MVSIAATSKKYRGRKAETYDEVRSTQARWKLENETVERMMLDLPLRALVLDCPVGTGRFIPMLTSMGYRVHGVDASDEMLALARKKEKHGPVKLVVGDATNLGDTQFDAAVCVRFLDLIDQDAMRKVMMELCRVTRSRIVLTIRLGPKYVPKVNTATHAKAAWLRLVMSLGWRVAETVPFRDAGWEIIKLERK